MKINDKTLTRRYLYPNGQVWTRYGKRRPNRLFYRKSAFSCGFRGLPRRMMAPAEIQRLHDRASKKDAAA